MALFRHPARRVVRALRDGSSWPVVVETAGGAYVVKLRGAAQGTPALVAEVIVAGLAEAVGLPVPGRAIVELDEHTPTDDRDEELLDLLGASRGENLGFRLLDGAAQIRLDQLHLVADDMARRIVWLDAWVMNPDRTRANPNILLWKRQPWLIDHGAALGFQYDWAGVSEDLPALPFPALRDHLLLARVQQLDAIPVGRSALERIVADVPDSFLAPMLDHSGFDDTGRLRSAYHAFLWKRLRAPGAFALP